LPRRVDLEGGAASEHHRVGKRAAIVLYAASRNRPLPAVTEIAVYSLPSLPSKLFPSTSSSTPLVERTATPRPSFPHWES
jgi:hypothetical protein